MGAVVGSLLPFVLTWLGVANVPSPGEKVAPSVIWAFYFGGGALLLSVLWTTFRTKEYPPKEYEQYNDITVEEKSSTSFLSLLTRYSSYDVETGHCSVLLMVCFVPDVGLYNNMVLHRMYGILYPEIPNRWILIMPVTGLGIIFACYSVVAALFSLVMGNIATRFGRKPTYMISLLLGGLGLISMVFIHNKFGLIFSMVGIGIAWAAILAMPYAILSAALPASKMGVYMGIFNATITIPQIAASLLGGLILSLVGGTSIMMLGVAGLSMLIAGVTVVFVKEHVIITDK